MFYNLREMMQDLEVVASSCTKSTTITQERSRCQYCKPHTLRKQGSSRAALIKTFSNLRKSECLAARASYGLANLQLHKRHSKQNMPEKTQSVWRPSWPRTKLFLLCILESSTVNPC